MVRSWGVWILSVNTVPLFSWHQLQLTVFTLFFLKVDLPVLMPKSREGLELCTREILNGGKKIKMANNDRNIVLAAKKIRKKPLVFPRSFSVATNYYFSKSPINFLLAIRMSHKMFHVKKTSFTLYTSEHYYSFHHVLRERLTWLLRLQLLHHTLFQISMLGVKSALIS